MNIGLKSKKKKQIEKAVGNKLHSEPHANVAQSVSQCIA